MLGRVSAMTALAAALCVAPNPTAAGSGGAAAAAPLVLDGDAPYIVPPELFRPSEAMSDDHSDTAQTLALRDVELDWSAAPSPPPILPADRKLTNRPGP